MRECILFNEQSDCIAYLNMTLISDLFIVFMIFWGLIEMFRIIINLMLNR